MVCLGNFWKILFSLLRLFNNELLLILDFLLNKPFPKLSFKSTSGIKVPAEINSVWMVIYIHPMISNSLDDLPKGWMNIPGAVGCTDQSCLFKDVYSDMIEFNTEIFGISTQPIQQQKVAKNRLGLPFDLMSDEKLLLKEKLHLPTFIVENKEYYKRLTLVLRKGTIQKVYYPVMNPHENLEDVFHFILSNQKKYTQ